MQDEVVNPVVQIVLDHLKEYYTQTSSTTAIDNIFLRKNIYFIVFEYPMGMFMDCGNRYELRLKKRIRKKKELLNKLAIVGCTQIYDF